MIIVGLGIDRGQKLIGTDCLRCLIGLGEEIIAIIGIRIARACEDSIARPTDRALGVKQAAPIDHAERLLAQIVGIGKIVGTENLFLQGPAISVDLDAGEVREARLTNERLGELVDTRFGYPYLGPLARGKDRMGGITTTARSTGGHGGTTPGRHRHRARLYIEHETDQHLPAAVANHKRGERDVEPSLATTHTYLLADDGERGQRVGRQCLVSGNVGQCHIDKLGIGNGNRISAVGIVCAERHGA